MMMAESLESIGRSQEALRMHQAEGRVDEDERTASGSRGESMVAAREPVSDVAGLTF